MPFTYQIRLNGEPIFATLGATVVDKLEEPLDEGALHIPITTRNVEYEMLGLLDIQVSKTGQTTQRFTYLVLSDKVTVKSKDGFYSHDLTVVEYTYKFDKYLVNALTFTKPFEKKVRAPFTYNEVVSVTTGLTIAPYYFYDDIYINETYFVNKEYTFSQTSQIDVLNNTINYSDAYFDKKDVYISFDGGTPLNLTTSNITHTFTTKGFKDIEIGYYDTTPTFIPIFTYHVSVINERRYTLWDMLQVVRATVPIESKFYHENYQTRLFDIDTNYETVFKKIEMPQMFFQKQTLRQVLNTIFKYINAISRLQYVDDGTDILTIDEFNKITGSFNLLGIVDYSSEQNAQNYASVAVSYLEKSLQTNFRENASVISPSANTFKTVRAKDIQLTQNGGGFILPLEYEMYEPTRIKVTIPYVEVRQARSLDSGMTTLSNAIKVLENYELDLTERFLNKDFWDLKTFTVDFPSYDEVATFKETVGLRENKGGNFFWQRNSKQIDFSYTVGTTIKTNAIITVIEEALNEEITRNKYVFDIADYPDAYGPLNATVVNVSNLETTFNSQTSTTDLLFRNLKFNVEYITFGNPTVKIEREDVKDFKYYSEIRINQQAKVTDFSRASRDVYGQIQRAGVPNITFSKRHFNLDDLLKVGMIDSNGYVITHRSLQFQNEFINARYQATKNHNRLNEYNGIDQEYRVFENPQLGYNRVDYYNDYVLIESPNGTEDLQFSFEPTFLKKEALPKIFSNLRNYHAENDNYKITYAMVRTDGFLENYPDDLYEYAIMVPIQSFGGKGTLVFEFGFDNNLYAGNAIYEQTLNSGGTDTYFNEPILYGDTQGFFDEIWFGMGDLSGATIPFDDIGEANEDYFNDGHKYPLVRTSSFESTQGFEIQSGSIDTTSELYNPIIAYKDASSNYYVSYGVMIKSKKYAEYILGNHFFTQNSLINKIANDFNVYLYKYTDGTQYGIFDDYTLKDGIYDTPVLLSTTNTSISSTTGLFTFLGTALINTSTHTSWAIADENGNLFMACNEPHNGFKVYLRHFNKSGLSSENPEDTGTIGNKPSTSIYVGFSETANITYKVSPTVLLNTTNDSFTVSPYINYNIEPILGVDIQTTVPISYTLTPTIDVSDLGSLSVTTVVAYEILPILGDDVTKSAYINYNVSPIIDISNFGSLNVTTEITYNINPQTFILEWVAGGTTPTVGQTCEVLSDVGNVRCDYIPPSCDWNYFGSYESSIDETANDGASCFIESSKVLCTQYERTVVVGTGYEWVTGGTTPTIGQTCAIADDLGNVKCTESCTWETDGLPYTSLTNDSVNPTGNCADYATKTVCTLSSEYQLTWESTTPQTPTGTSCSILGDAGNVRCDSSCAFVEDEGQFYISATNDTNNPTCDQDVERITCTLNKQTNNWECMVEVGQITYSNCEVCTVNDVYDCQDYVSNTVYSNCQICDDYLIFGQEIYYICDIYYSDEEEEQWVNCETCTETG